MRNCLRLISISVGTTDWVRQSADSVGYFGRCPDCRVMEFAEAVGRKSRRGWRLLPPCLNRAGFEPCVRAASSSRVVGLSSVEMQRGGVPTERLKSGAANSWGKPNPGRAEIFALPLRSPLIQHLNQLLLAVEQVEGNEGHGF
jgi:hypothetical protein